MLVVGCFHVAAQLVRRRPEMRLETEVGATVVCLFRHPVTTRFLQFRGIRIAPRLFLLLDRLRRDDGPTVLVL